MIEIILIVFVIPRQIFPIARGCGVNALAWSGLAVVVFVGVGGLAALGATFAAIWLFRSPVGVDREIQAIGLLFGLIGVGLLGRYLNWRYPVNTVPLPPFPPDFV